MSMCRAIGPHYRRCKGDRRAEYARTSVKRLQERLEMLEDTGAGDDVFERSAERYESAVSRLVEREAERADNHSAYGLPAPSTAGEYTPETVAEMDNDAYFQTQHMVWGQDPKAAYSLALSDAGATLTDEGHSDFESEPDEWPDYPDDEISEHDEIGALAGGLSRDEYAREEWERHMMQSYFDAEDKTGGALLNRHGREAGIDVFSLFSGSAERASKYASDELKAYWQENGRHTAASHRYTLLKRPSDKESYEYATTQARFDDAAAVL